MYHERASLEAFLVSITLKYIQKEYLWNSKNSIKNQFSVKPDSDSLFDGMFTFNIMKTDMLSRLPGIFFFFWKNKNLGQWEEHRKGSTFM